MPSAPVGLCDRLLAFLDIGGRPDRVEGLVEAEPRIDVAREFVGLGDDRFERRADESVAMRLAAGQRARIAAKEWQVRGEFLAKGHERVFSLEIAICAVFGGAPELLQPWKDRVACVGLTAPRDVKPIWNKGPAIWFPRLGRARCKLHDAAQRAGLFCMRSGPPRVRAVAPESEICMTRAEDPREGGRGVECQEAKRDGGSRAFQALEEVRSFRSRVAQAALGRSWPCASLGL